MWARNSAQKMLLTLMHSSIQNWRSRDDNSGKKLRTIGVQDSNILELPSLTFPGSKFPITWPSKSEFRQESNTYTYDALLQASTSFSAIVVIMMYYLYYMLLILITGFLFIFVLLFKRSPIHLFINVYCHQKISIMLVLFIA